MAWSVCVTFLLGALAPGMGRAMVAAGLAGGEWVEICTSSGTLWISAATGDALGAGKDGGAFAGGHANCPWCALQIDALALPPAAFPLLAAPSLPGFQLAAGVAAAQASARWAGAHPRGPPVFC